AARAHEQLSTHAGTQMAQAVARARQQLSAQNAPIMAALARAQEQYSAQAQSTVLAHQQGMQALMQSLAPALRATTATQALSQPAVRAALQAAANPSWQRKMQAAIPLLQDRFAPQVLEVVDTALGALQGTTEEAAPAALSDDLSEETVREIEEALGSFEATVEGLSPAVARRLWILWVQVFVFALCLQALVLLPVAAEIAALMGSGAIPAAQQAGLAAAKVWDKMHGQPDSAASTEE
ncbi:hypothetical protein, partial [Streptomyces chryseus]